MMLITLMWKYRNVLAGAVLLAIVAACLGKIYLRGEDAGRAEIQAQWDADKLRQAAALAQSKARTEDDIASATAALSQQLSARDRATMAAMKGIRDEIAQNAAYRDCHVTAGGVRLYNAAGLPAAESGQDPR